jgi:hypothetical protein
MVDSREHSTKASASVSLPSLAQTIKHQISSPAHSFQDKYTDLPCSLPQAGLNLNVLGAVSGVFSGKSKKEIAKDGSSTEWRDDKAAVDGGSRGYFLLGVVCGELLTFVGVGGGNASAVGAADVEESKKSHQGAMADKSFF